jgi:hypothetical protein
MRIIVCHHYMSWPAMLIIILDRPPVQVYVSTALHVLEVSPLRAPQVFCAPLALSSFGLGEHIAGVPLRLLSLV